MYCEHFGLSAAPFSNTPDPRFFFRTPDHEEALASLLYVAQERKGFAAVTGEVGTGKTLLSRMLLARLPVGARTAMLTHTGMNGTELLSAICNEFQITAGQGGAPAEMFQNLEDYLLEQYARDRLVVVVLDEAQNLPVDAFEQLRMLGNLEAEDAKLLQVLILGQPELSTLLSRNDMRQLRQRIYRTYDLKPLTAEQTIEYVEHRLNVAGAGGRTIIEAEAVAAVHRHARGLPRLINQLCDNGMLIAYGQDQATVTEAIIHEVAAHIPACMDAHYERQQSPPEPDSKTPIRAPARKPASGRAAQAQTVETALPPDDAIAKTRADLDRELAQARDLRVAASQLMTDLRRYAGDTRAQLSAMLTTAEAGAREVNQRMADAAAEAARTQADLTQQLLSAARHRGGPGSAADPAVVTAMQRHFEAVRGEVAALASGLHQRIEETEKRTSEVRQQVRGELDRLPETLQGLSQSTAVRTHAARGELDTLLDQAREALTETHARFRETVSAADSEVRGACSALTDLRQRAEADAGALRSMLGDVTGRCESLISETRHRVESAAADLQARTQQLIHEAAAQCRAAVAEVAGRAAAADAALARERDDVLTLRERLEQQIRSADERLERLGLAIRATEREDEIERVSSRVLERVDGDLHERRRRAADELEDLLAEHRNQTSRLTQTLKSALAEARGTVDQIIESANKGLNELREGERSVAARMRELAVGDGDAGRNGQANASLAALQSAVDDVRSRLSSALAFATTGVADLEHRIQRANSDATELRQQSNDAEQSIAQAREEAARLMSGLTDQLRAVLDAGVAAEGSERERTAIRPTIAAVLGALRGMNGEVERIAAAINGAAAAGPKLEAACGRAEALHVRFEDAQEDARRNLADIVREAQRRVDAASEALNRAWSEHAEKLREFKGAVETDLAAAGREATITIERAQTESRAAEKLVDSVVIRGEQALTALRERIGAALAAVEQRVGESGRSADSLAAKLHDAVESARTEILRLRSQLDADCLRLREELTAFDEGSDASLERAGRAYREMNNHAEAAVANLQRHVGDVQARLSALWDEAGQRLGEIAGQTGEQAETLRRETERTFSEFGGRLSEAEKQTCRSIAQAEVVVGTLNAAVRDAETGLRTRIDDITQRGDAIARELSDLGRQARETAEKAGVTLRDTAQSAVTQIEEQRALAAREARSHQQKLAALLADVDNRTTRVRQDARELLTAAQRGAAEVREQAGTLLESSRGDAAKIADQAGRLLEQARAAADAFRQQAENLMHRAEGGARELESHVQRVRQELGEDRREMRAAVETAAAERGAAHARTQELLARAEFVQDRTLKLLELPRQVLDEAQQRSDDLRKMSKAIATAVAKLGEASRQAEQRAAGLQGADARAAERMEEIQLQTNRVGQLLVVLRQLYSRMDARIEHMRDKLGMAENLAHTLPGELQLIRTALSGPGRMSGTAAPADAQAVPAANGRRKSGHMVIVPAGQAVQPPAAPRRATPAAAGRSAKSLGELVKKNERLNAWLKQQIDNAGSEAPATASAT